MSEVILQRIEKCMDMKKQHSELIAECDEYILDALRILDAMRESKDEG